MMCTNRLDQTATLESHLQIKSKKEDISHHLLELSCHCDKFAIFFFFQVLELFHFLAFAFCGNSVHQQHPCIDFLPFSPPTYSNPSKNNNVELIWDTATEVNIAAQLMYFSHRHHCASMN